MIKRILGWVVNTFYREDPTVYPNIPKWITLIIKTLYPMDHKRGRW